MRRRDDGALGGGEDAYRSWNVRGCLGRLRDKGTSGSLPEAAWEAFGAAGAIGLRWLRRRYRVQAADLDDLLQQVWAKAVAGLPEGRNTPAELAAWFHRVLRTTAADLFRAKARQRTLPLETLIGTRQEPVARHGDPEKGAERLAQAEDVRARLERLRVSDDLNDQVLVLRILDGLSIKRVAEQLRLSERNVRDRLWRGKRKFRRSLRGGKPSQTGRDG